MNTQAKYNWAEFAALRPQLREHMRIYAQDYRGERWYILRDDSNGRFLRFNNIAHDFIGRMDGDHTLEEICQLLQQKTGEQYVDCDEIVLIVNQLLSIDALKSGTHKKSSDIFRKFQKEKRLKRQRAIMNPLSIRTALFDPDRLLNRLVPWVRPLFSYTGLCVWVCAVMSAGLLALSNYYSLSAAINSDILAPSNLVYMSIIFVLLKIIHEFAHAFTVKMWGGEVHEMGISLLVLMPVPYVDASAATSFRSKYKRMLVGAAGIIVELFIASIALFVWYIVEPGMIKDVALNTFLIASVSTLLFNANPLLRFDGFYILQDYIEIPNLYTRSGLYYLYWVQRYLFGVAHAKSPVMANGERTWFLVYGLASRVYRLVILVAIVFFLAKEYLFIGVALAMWAIFMQLIMPIWKAIHFLRRSPLLQGRRKPAIAISTGIVSVLLCALLFIPIPVVIQSEGVLWVSGQAEIFAETEGFITEAFVTPGDDVGAGMMIARLSNPDLRKKISVLQARREELTIRSVADRATQRVKSQLADEELVSINAELTLLETQAGKLVIRAAVAGVFVQADNRALSGRYLKKGELLGYMVSPENLIVRSVVPQSTIGLVLNSSDQVEIKFAELLQQTFLASMPKREPVAKNRLPSAALGVVGGGNIPVLSEDQKGLTTAEKVFQIDLTLTDDPGPLAGLGERAFVRFLHKSEPLAFQWWRAGRQLVLSRLGG